MTIDDITVGTLGGLDWEYANAAPMGTKLNWTVRPATVYVTSIVPEESYEGDYGRYLLDDVLDVIIDRTPTWYDVKTTYPRTTIVGPKLAGYVNHISLDEYDWENIIIMCNVGGTIRTAKYGDLTDKAHPSHIFGTVTASWSGLGPMGNWDKGICSTNADDELVVYLQRDLLSGDESTWFNTIPVFDSTGDIDGYLESLDPDPTHFGGYFNYGDYEYEGEDPEEENLNEPGDVIEGLGTDLGVSLSDGVIRGFICSNEELADLASKIGSGWFADNIGKAIISVKLIRTPGAIETLETQTIIPSSTFSSVTVSGRYVTNQFQKFELGTYTIPESFNSFMDYTNTTVSLYLPFSGIHQLEAKTVMGGKITITAYVDYISGTVIYYVTVNRDGVKQVIYEWSGNCSMEIPLTSVDYSQKITQLMSGVMTTMSGIASNNPMYAIGGATQMAQGLSDNYISVSNLSSNTGWTGIMYCYLIFQRSKVGYSDNYKQTLGLPSMKQATLSSLTGYTKVYDIHLDGILASKSEKDKLYNLLKAGVIL